ncbi:hypothetical protein CI102_12011 [Trichoderma harzianum]|nr:hypothetical protein CI102_12011 [Trichoderma harzianum]
MQKGGNKAGKAKRQKQEAKHKRFDLAFHLAALRDKIASRHRRQKVRRAILAQKTQLLEKLPLSVCFSPFLLLSKQFKKDEKMSKCRRPVIHPAKVREPLPFPKCPTPIQSSPAQPVSLFASLPSCSRIL